MRLIHAPARIGLQVGQRGKRQCFLGHRKILIKRCLSGVGGEYDVATAIGNVTLAMIMLA